MSYGDEKIVIKLREGEKDGALIETTEEGKERTYYRKRFGTHWTCERLQVRRGFAYGDKEDRSTPKMHAYVVGVARLTSDFDLSLIGEPKNTTATLQVSWYPDDSLDLLSKRDQEGDEEFAFQLSQRCGLANLGFNRADWETECDDQWWLQCRLHSTALQPLIDAISAETLEQVNLSVRLKDLFTDEPPYMPFSRDGHLFLRPNKSDNTIDIPEMAHGWLEGLDFGLRTTTVGRTPEPVPTVDQAEMEPESAPLSSHPTVPALQVVAVRIEGLRSTVKWVGGLIAVVLVLLLLK